MKPRYHTDGMRLTDCCGGSSTYMDDGTGSQDLCCKRCYRIVPAGQGDGAEFLPGTDPTDAPSQVVRTDHPHAVFGSRQNALRYYAEHGVAIWIRSADASAVVFFRGENGQRRQRTIPTERVKAVVG